MEAKHEIQVQSEGKPFIDPASGRSFRKFKYFDFEVIQDVETGWVNAGQFISKLEEGKEHPRDISHFKASGTFYQNALEIGRELILSGNEDPRKFGSSNAIEKPDFDIENNDSIFTIEKALFVKCKKGYGFELHGTYVPFRIFQIIAIWIDKKHLAAVLVLLEKLNDKANLLNKSAYDVLNDEVDHLNKEIEELKSQCEELKERHEDDLKVIEDFNKPFNQQVTVPVIYALKENDEYFQLRIDRTGYGTNGIRKISMINAQDVKTYALKELERRHIIEHLNGKRLIKHSQMDEVFKLLQEIKDCDMIVLPSQEEKRKFINEKLENLKSKPFTSQNEGLIYEYEIIQKHQEMIPWKMLPLNLLNQLGEEVRDNGIDAVEFSSEKKIKTIYQIKHHRETYLRIDEVQSFITKSLEKKYKDVKKILIVHGCKLGKKLSDKITASGIEIKVL